MNGEKNQSLVHWDKLRLIMKSSDVAEVGKLLEWEFTDHADTVDISTPGFTWMDGWMKEGLIDVQFNTDTSIWLTIRYR